MLKTLLLKASFEIKLLSVCQEAKIKEAEESLDPGAGRSRAAGLAKEKRTARDSCGQQGRGVGCPGEVMPGHSGKLCRERHLCSTDTRLSMPKDNTPCLKLALYIYFYICIKRCLSAEPFQKVGRGGKRKAADSSLFLFLCPFQPPHSNIIVTPIYERQQTRRQGIG